MLKSMSKHIALLTCALLASLSPISNDIFSGKLCISNAVAQEIDDDIEDEVDDKIEEKIEEKVEEKVEEKIEDKIETKVEDKVENKVEDSVEEGVEDHIDKRSQDKIDKKSEHTIETRIEHETSNADHNSDRHTDRSGQSHDHEERLSALDPKKDIQTRFDAAEQILDSQFRLALDAAVDFKTRALDEARRLYEMDLAAGIKDKDLLKAEYDASKEAIESAYEVMKSEAETAYEASSEAQKEQEDNLIAEAEDEAENDSAFENMDDESNIALVGDSSDLRDIDIDPDGFSVARGEWLVMGSAEDMLQLAAAGFILRSQDELPSLDRVVSRVVSPTKMALIEAQDRIQQLAPGAIVDYNHLYSPQFASHHIAAIGETPRQAFPMPEKAALIQKKIGLIDTMVVSGLPAISGASIVTKDFVSSSNARPFDHGTAVASILVGHGQDYAGLLPRAKLYAASVFENLPGRPSTATTMSLVRALDWMAANDVGIVNMSLTGPPNEILQAAITRARAHGITVVAAIGNEGPNAKPLYPAGYEGVVAVTAINHNHQIFRLANRGKHLDFAAPGVDIIHLAPSGHLEASTGTSIAAPFVAATLLLSSDESGHVTKKSLNLLEKSALDLGKNGFDTVYGFGLINPIP